MPQRLVAAFCRVLREREFPPLEIIDMLITEDCNCRCDYCFIHGKRPRRMSEEVVKATVDFLLLKSRHLSRPEILFFGGEPLLAFDLMQLTVDYGEWQAERYHKRIKYSMTTNGTLFDEEKLEFCRKHGIKFLLSLDGDEKTHNAHRRFADGRGTYRTVVDLIPLMKQYQPWLGVRMTPTPENLRRVADNVAHLHSLGINQFIIGPATGLRYTATDVGIYKEQLRKLLDFYLERKKAKAPLRIGLFEQEKDSMPGSKRGIWGCGAGRGRLSVSARGEIQPCAKVQGLGELAGIPCYSLGNVLTGFTDLEARRKFTAFRYDLRTPCHDCDLKDDCAGGCPAVNYEATGSIFLPDESECRLTRAFHEIKREACARREAAGLA